MIKHHLTPELLMSYSAGTLPEALNLVVAAHVSMCDACRAEVEGYDAVGGTLLDRDGGDGVSESCLTGALGRIRADAPVSADTTVKAADPRVPAPLAAYIGGRLEDVNWRPVGMGVKQAILATSPEATARLLYIPAGTAVPDHGHRGIEVTMVLQGAFEDEDGRFARGDVEVAAEDLQHTPVADISEDCICLAVTDAPLRFKGLLPRLAQPFLKI
ncbi:ChrR family anti-sigma-E factor [Thalassococcus sp. BH17M4-6]|uniref:ChrR family anti-sigma-E factor n=1 Tax=Thalassococcus sp. BH17M4-6 TaxID=3413148 RepID=UPI003BD214D4